MKRLLSTPILVFLCLAACTPFTPYGNRAGESEEIGFTPPLRDRVWTVERPAAPDDPPMADHWRRRYESWRNGTLRDYPFEPYGVPARPTASATEPPIQLPPRSVHETEPWGDDGCVWPTLSRWSPVWESRWRQWIEETATADFLLKHNIEVDCSDAPYVFRWIFARINYLPMGVHDGSGSLVFGNWNIRFAYLPTDPDWRYDLRFRAALDWAVRQYIRGQSIPFDTYPCAITPESGAFGPGTVAADEHHVRLVHRINPDSADPVRQLSATRPRKLRLLYDETLTSALEHTGPGWGIVNFSWWEYDFNLHRWRTVPDEQMPGYSLHQYEFRDGCTDYIQTVFRDRSKPIDPAEAIGSQISDLRQMLISRAEIVRDGYAHYQVRPRDRDKSTIAYDDYSTPERDARIAGKIELIRQMAREYGYDEDWLQRQFASVNIDIGEGQSLDLHSIVYRIDRNLLSHEPWDPPAMRWGMP